MLEFNIERPLSKNDLRAFQLATSAREQRSKQLGRIQGWAGVSTMITGVVFVIYGVSHRLVVDRLLDIYTIHVGRVDLLLLAIFIGSVIAIYTTEQLREQILRGNDSELSVSGAFHILEADSDPIGTLAVAQSWPEAHAYIERVAAQGRKLTIFEAENLRTANDVQARKASRVAAEVMLYGQDLINSLPDSQIS